MEEKLCFVVMGFGKKTDLASGNTFDLDKTYQNIIKPIVSECGYKCVRADEVQDTGLIDRSMYALILWADLVIADISTLNPNAIYELGVRHAVKPSSTIIIKAESTSKIPFDIDHTRVFSYKHLGEDVGVDEANRMKKLLKEKILNIAKGSVKDSPVYEYLHTLQEPHMDIEEYKDIVGALAEKNDCIFALVESAKLLMKEGNFSEAIKYWKKALEKNPTEPYYIQQLALCTYKQKVSKEEQEMYLNDALRILERLADSNDPETFGLKGAIYKRLSRINNDNIGYLNRAIEYYEKGYMISYDFYTGENLAFCFDKKSALLNDGEDEKIYCRIQAKKIREQLYKILSSKMELEDITNIPNVKWMSATFSICCYALGKQEEGRKYEKLFKDMAEQWEKDTYNFQKEELKQLINIEVVNMAKIYKVFISHSWAHVNDLKSLRNLLESRGYFSVEFTEFPPTDSINSMNTYYIRQRITERIQTSDIVLGIAGIYASHSDWMKWELDKAIEKRVPIIGVIPRGQERISSIVSNRAIEIVHWNTESIVSAIRKTI